MKEERGIIFYKHYFIDFYINQNQKVQLKIDYVFMVLKTVNIIPTSFIKHISGSEGLYEVRIQYESDIFRIFCCFDQGNIIVLFNACQKKSQKLPMKEIRKAITLKQEYIQSKKDIP
ncbi:MAG: type II toxin-antitoxin system RelE/ParE family toxin [Bacteroidota bacterium]|jgi:phage-related protein